MTFGVLIPIKLAQLVTILTCFREVQIRISGGDTDYSEVLRGFPRPTEANAGTAPSTTPRSLHCTSFQTLYSSSLYHKTLLG
jgi:hypothetical protein